MSSRLGRTPRPRILLPVAHCNVHRGGRWTLLDAVAADVHVEERIGVAAGGKVVVVGAVEVAAAEAESAEDGAHAGARSLQEMTRNSRAYRRHATDGPRKGRNGRAAP